MLNKNDVFEIEITAMTNEGNGVGHLQGMAVFIPYTVPGDIIRARIVKQLPRYAYGRLEKIVTPSVYRREVDCPAAKRCGGCSFRHIQYEKEKEIKFLFVRDAFERIGGIPNCCKPLISTDKVRGYRNKAMLPIREIDGEIRMGFYAKRSHEVIHHPNCELQPEEFSFFAHAVREYAEKHHISCYNEKTTQGLLRHLYLRKAFATGELMVCLIINGETLPHADQLIKNLLSLNVPPTSIAININKENTNVILGKTTQILWGKSQIVDKLCGIDVYLSPESFYQVNREAAELLYKKATEYAQLTGKEILVDLYCGAGTIGLSMARKVKKVIGVEIVPAAVADAIKNAQQNNITNAEFICSDAANAAQKFVQEGIKPDVIIVDPPRKGCDENVLLSIAKMAPQKLIMISCNPSTAARDCKRLEQLSFQVLEATPFDLFPRTPHVECVIMMQNCVLK